MKKITMILCVLVLGFVSFAKAQQTASTHFGLGLQIGIPNGDFKDNTSAAGVGGSLAGFFPFSPNIPIYFGVELGYMNYGSTTTRINQTVNVNTGFVNFNIPLNYRIVTNNNLLNGHVGLRFMAPLPLVRPYMDVLVGGRYIYTRTRVIDDSPSNNVTTSTTGNQTTTSEVVAGRTIAQDWIFSYGGGLGVQIGRGALRFDLRCVYLWGSEADYLDRKAVEQATIANGGIKVTTNPTNGGASNFNSSIEYTNLNLKTSRTDMFFINAGLVFSFGGN